MSASAQEPLVGVINAGSSSVKFSFYEGESRIFTGQVDGIVRRITAEVGGPVTAVVATGGLAEAIVQESETITHHVPELTLLGLRLVFERNT